MLKRQLISVLVFLILIPVTIAGCYFLLKGKQYYIASVIILLLASISFFLSLERKKLQARELVTLSSIVAIAVASRAAFFMLPQVKPTCAVVIIAAVVFGKEIGFSVGALSMLLSNIMFGQGMFTPFQMFGMGMVGLIFGLLFHDKRLWKNRFVLSIIGGIVCFAVYGIIVDTSSVFIMSKSVTLTSALAIYTSGVPFNAAHGASTFVFLMLFGPNAIETVERIKIKYDLFGEVEK